jgi:HprK-related kinase B
VTELQQLQQGLRTEAPLALSVAGVGLIVRATDRQVRAALSAYFEPYRVPAIDPTSAVVTLVHGTPIFDAARLRDVPPKPGRPPKDAYYDAPDARVILKRRTGVVIYVSGRDVIVAGDLRANLNQTVNAITMAYTRVLLGRGYGLLHASATAQGSRGVAFTSASGTGKSTTALALVDRGHRFVTNDRLMVRATRGGVEMVGVPKRPRVNPGTMMQIGRLTQTLSRAEQAEYRAIEPDALWTLERKRDVDLDSLYGPEARVLQSGLHVIYVLRWSRAGQGWSERWLEAPERRTVLSEFAKSLGVYETSPASEDRTHRIFGTVADAIAVCEIGGSVDVPRLTDAVASHLQGGAPR